MTLAIPATHVILAIHVTLATLLAQVFLCNYAKYIFIYKNYKFGKNNIMRLWHKSLIPVLPRKQLLGQWLECNIIINKLNKENTIKHIIVKRVLEYPLSDFISYVTMIQQEMIRRGYSPKETTLLNCKKIPIHLFKTNKYSKDNIFASWHNDRYLKQCYYNLQEKYDCGSIEEKDWLNIANLLSSKHIL